jgi:dienelactone hydrolase
MRATLRAFVVILTATVSLHGAAIENWVAVIESSKTPTRADLHIEVVAGKITGSADLPFEDKMGLPVSGHLDDRRLEIRFDDVEFAATRTGRFAEGRTNSGAPVHLAQIDSIDRNAINELAGLYEFSPGHVLAFTHFPVGLVYTDFDSGRTGGLLPVSRDEFIGGPAVAVPLPIRVRAHFGRDGSGHVISVRFGLDDASEHTAKRIRFRQEEIEFKSTDVKLSGTLTLPNGSGPFAATLRIAGAGPLTRVTTADEYSAYQGVAFFSYDKRGTGKSTGDWRGTSVKDLTDDARAALTMLKNRSDIDANRLSIGAGSEGAWPAAVLVHENPSLAGIALYAGPVLPYLDEFLAEVRASLINDGFSGVALEEAVAFEKDVHNVIKRTGLRTDADWTEYENLVAAHKNEKWISDVTSWPRNDRRWTKFLAMASFDPTEVWGTTRVPILALYGGKDINVPAMANVAALQAFVAQSRNPDVVIKVFPDANHEFMQAKTGDLEREAPYLSKYVPGFYELSTDWTRKHLHVH